MVNPLLPIARKVARKVYRDARGRFVSKAKYELERRRGPGGRFLTKSRAAQNRSIETYLRARLGAPPAGKSWHQIASKYPERFMDYVEDIQ